MLLVVFTRQMFAITRDSSPLECMAFTLFGFEQKELLNATNRAANIKMNHLDLDIKKFENAKIPERQSRGYGGGGFGRGGRPEGHRSGGFHGARRGGSGYRGGGNRDRGSSHHGGGGHGHGHSGGSGGGGRRY